MYIKRLLAKIFLFAAAWRASSVPKFFLEYFIYVYTYNRRRSWRSSVKCFIILFFLLCTAAYKTLSMIEPNWWLPATSTHFTFQRPTQKNFYFIPKSRPHAFLVCCCHSGALVPSGPRLILCNFWHSGLSELVSTYHHPQFATPTKISLFCPIPECASMTNMNKHHMIVVTVTVIHRGKTFSFMENLVSVFLLCMERNRTRRRCWWW